VNIEKQIDYWKTGSEEDIEVAAELLEKNRLRYGLFFAHLAIEKILKAHVTKVTKKIPPYIHNLVRLAKIARINLDLERATFLRDFEVYHVEGRYPDAVQIPLDFETARREIARAKEMLKWLTDQL